MEVYNYNVDNKRKLSEEEFRNILSQQNSKYNFDKLKDLKEFDFYSLLAIKGNEY